MKRRIKVTKDHIKLGHRGRFCFCPVAIALLDAGFERVYVTGDQIRFELYHGNQRVNVEVDAPKSVAKFVDIFDEKGKVEPFGFTLEYDPETQGTVVR